MKKLLVLSLLSLSISAFANCKQYEAQFSGTVTKVEMTATTCNLDIDFDLYNEHFFCPLLQEEVEVKKVTVTKEECSDIIGKKIGGILFYNSANDSIEIE